ncbi:zinc finger protein 678-like isoform X2 [Paramacrobiotus metropolitanus]|uniref:zinc finger protein 678-like isoform X2 n=1 Tax=Paramacrobiotus metropolitanus TaxID=2943436 RepID=UPI002445F244|nr:zinc finger protein 678-like isoform X2 [Paramacrobiotus metropolitanus]
MYKFKILFESDGTSRRFNLDEPCDGDEETLFHKLRAKILTMIPPDQDILLYWQDEINSRIICESEEELRIAMEECPSAATGITQLTVIPSVIRLSTPTAPPQPDAVLNIVKMPAERERRRCVCDTCGRAFKSRSHLVDHMRTHTGERPYRCELCGNTYRHRTSLKGHMNSHTGQFAELKHSSLENCVVDNIEKTIPTQSAGAKPHKCAFPGCTYESAWSSYMAEHMRQMHGTRSAESEERELRRKLSVAEGKKGKKKGRKPVTPKAEDAGLPVSEGGVTQDEPASPSRALRSGKKIQPGRKKRQRKQAPQKAQEEEEQEDQETAEINPDQFEDAKLMETNGTVS